MYCAACGTPIAPGLSYCNRCGSSLKERTDTKTGAITAFLTAITLIGIIGLGIMLGGAIALRKEANVGEDVMGFFMFLTFFIVGLTEFLLIRQLSKLTGSLERKVIDTPQYPVMQNELRPAQPRSLAEPVSSVTENTTRTLEYSRNESTR
jgi:predicted nucleic acid-binding Zn ribbon protein